MDYYKILKVLEISLPVFALIGLGKMLAVKHILKPEIMAVINRLIVYFSLPALIFLAIASQSLKSLLDIPIIVSTIAASTISFLLLLCAGYLLGLKGKIYGAFMPSGFWGNMAYMGFPLAVSAFGTAGLEKAAVVNGFTGPLYVFFGSIILSLFSSRQSGTFNQMVLKILINPIVMSCYIGLTAAAALDISGLREPGHPPPALLALNQIIVKTLQLLGSMGLPLALISVGASLKFSTMRTCRHLIALSTLTKLVITPLVTFGIIRLFFPNADRVSLGVAVLLMTTPTAFVYTVVSQGLDVEGEFTAAVVVITTTLSVLTIPIWLYFL